MEAVEVAAVVVEAVEDEDEEEDAVLTTAMVSVVCESPLCSFTATPVNTQEEECHVWGVQVLFKKKQTNKTRKSEK